MNVPEEQENTIIWTLDPETPEASLLVEAGRLIRDGQLIAFPTETVYGLGANALDSAAVAKIFIAKGRPSYNPLIVHVVGAAMRQELVADWPEKAAKLADAFWPGPLTLILPKTSLVPDNVTAGGHTVAIREPANPIARGLISAANVPIAAPSANRSNEISPTLAKHVRRGLSGRIHGIIDGGACSAGIESTVIDLSGATPRILRPGPISQHMLEEIIGPVETTSGHLVPGHLPSPGMLAKHYSPRTQTVMRPLSAITGITGNRVVVSHIPVQCACRVIDLTDHPAEYARRIYAVLHELDQQAYEQIVIIEPPNTPDWAGIHDRLTRASHQGE